MWRYGRWIPVAGDPHDPERFHEALQPFADGAQALDEHDFAAGGVTNDNVDSVFYADDAGTEPDHQGTWATAPTITNAEEHEPNVGWLKIANASVSAVFGGGLVWIIGMVQVLLDASGSYLSQLDIGILVDGQLYLTVDSPEAAEDLDNIIWGRFHLANVIALDLIVPIPAGDHTVELAIKVVGVNSAYTHSAQVGVIELRC